MLLAIRRRFAAIFDAIDSPSVRRRLEKLVVAGAAIGFLVHLGVIGVAHYLPHLPETVFKGLDESPLHAVYTPFSVILLVFALAASHTGEIAKQYQIISLIVVRRVFKDIGSFSELENWLAEPEEVRAVLLADAALHLDASSIVPTIDIDAEPQDLQYGWAVAVDF